MNALTFRNKLGELVDIRSVPATRLKNEFGTIFEQAIRSGAIAITKHDTARAILISVEEFKTRHADLMASRLCASVWPAAHAHAVEVRVRTFITVLLHDDPVLRRDGAVAAVQDLLSQFPTAARSATPAGPTDAS